MVHVGWMVVDAMPLACAKSFVFSALIGALSNAIWLAEEGFHIF